MRAEAIAAAEQHNTEAARRRVDEWIRGVRGAQAEYRKIVGEPAPHLSVWVPGERGEPTVCVDGVTLSYVRDYKSSLSEKRLHLGDEPVRSLAQLGALILRADAEEATDAEGGPRG